MSRDKVCVLDVGQCDMDHGTIRQMLADTFGAEVDRAHTASEANDAVGKTAYDLVLVNRIFDVDHSEGLDLIRSWQTNNAIGDMPVMLISNFEDAQQAAIDLGAKPGFGKNAVTHSETIDHIAAVLGSPSTKSER